MSNNSTIIVNRVAKSGIVTLNLEDFYPTQEIVTFDIKDFLFMGLILKEKDFRASLKTHDWAQYADKHVAIICSADAIVPVWAYMLIGIKLQDVAVSYMFANTNTLLSHLYEQALSKISLSDYADKRVVIKGCGAKPVPASAYVRITNLLQPVVKTLMYGEPCSMVPLYKKASLSRKRR